MIGLDIGTSYIKLCLLDEAGTRLMQCRKQSPTFSEAHVIDTTYASTLFDSIENTLQRVIKHSIQCRCTPLALAITGVSPVLVAFDPDNPGEATTIPYWYIPSIDGTSVGIERTIRRIEYLTAYTNLKKRRATFLVDLIGYLNYRLTGNLSMNSITAGEIGISEDRSSDAVKSDLEHLFPGIPLQSPSDICGRATLRTGYSTAHVQVCVGATDSFGAAIAGRCTVSGSHMIYLGTFGSLMTVTQDLLPTLSHKVAIPTLPYRWSLSVPRFGPEVEHFASGKFPSVNTLSSLQEMDKFAAMSRPGANGILFHVPIWDRLGADHGHFGFVSRDNTTVYSKSAQARAVLEGLGHRIVVSRLVEDSMAAGCGVAGGGARSATWAQTLADVLGLPLRVSSSTPDAWPAAFIAGTALGWEHLMSEIGGALKVFRPNIKDHAKASETSEFASKWYAQNGWPTR